MTRRPAIAHGGYGGQAPQCSWSVTSRSGLRWCGCAGPVRRHLRGDSSDGWQGDGLRSMIVGSLSTGGCPARATDMDAIGRRRTTMAARFLHRQHSDLRSHVEDARHFRVRKTAISPPQSAHVRTRGSQTCEHQGQAAIGGRGSDESTPVQHVDAIRGGRSAIGFGQGVAVFPGAVTLDVFGGHSSTGGWLGLLPPPRRGGPRTKSGVTAGLC